MAIITISQIKHRRGIVGTDPMPQLAGAELGWSIDNQELFIGNDTIENGAPTEGNTRILTEHSDLIALLSDYTYNGPFNGAVMQTGADVSTPISRSFIQRFNDNVSARSFGATGDGVTDDIDALERVIYQHTLQQPLSQRYWTVIYVPAGTYRISRPLRIPSHVRLVGDGAKSTRILLDVAGTAVVEITKMQDPNTFGDVFPEDIKLVGITFEATQPSTNGLVIGDANDILVDHCAFICGSVDTKILGTNNAAVLFDNRIKSTTNIRFTNCKFNKATYGIASGIPDNIVTRQDISNIVVNNSQFIDLYKAVILGNEVNPAFGWPRNIRFTQNFFDKVTTEGIHLYKVSKFTSGQNHFADVGNRQIGVLTSNNIVFGDFGADNPAEPIIDLTAYQNNYSMGDTFDRTDADNLIVPRIKSNCLRSYIIDSEEIRYGTLQTEPGKLFMLTDNTSTPTSTGIVLPGNKYQGAVIDYQLNREDDKQRYGTIKISQGTTGNSFQEEFNEVTPVGVTFSASFNAGITTIDYVSSAEAKNIVFSYSIKHLTCPTAIPSTPIVVAPVIDPIGNINNSQPPGATVAIQPTVTLNNLDISILYDTVTLVSFGAHNAFQIAVDGTFDTLLWEIVNTGSTNPPTIPGQTVNQTITNGDTIDPTVADSSGLPIYVEVRLTATDSVTGLTDSATMIYQNSGV